jgi:hypothetical protein
VTKTKRWALIRNVNISQVIVFFLCIFREVFFAVQLGRKREREGEIERASRENNTNELAADKTFILFLYVLYVA